MKGVFFKMFPLPSIAQLLHPTSLRHLNRSCSGAFQEILKSESPFIPNLGTQYVQKHCEGFCRFSMLRA